MVLVWAAIVLPLVELQVNPSLTVTVSQITIPNPLTKLAVVLWILGIMRLLNIVYRIFKLDFIRFNKSAIPRDSNAPTAWGVEGIDQKLAGRARGNYYPVVIAADENSRPWNILQRFIIAGRIASPESHGSVYFTFTRPADVILAQLKSTAERGFGLTKSDAQKLMMERVVIVDCYTQFAKQEETTRTSSDQVLRADPNNPHDVNRQYEKALKRLLKADCKSFRVAYDAISDFLVLTDLQLATQYLRHNMVWEGRHDIQSLYVLRAGTLKSELEQYFFWFANGTLKLTMSSPSQGEAYLQADFRGPFKHAITFKLDFDYKLLP